MLKYLNDRVESAVAEEERGEIITVSALAGIGDTTPTHLCGFEMPAEMVRTDALIRDRKGRLERITAYRNDAAHARTALGSIGVTSLAVITEKAFDELVRRMGLFTLYPSERGSVVVNNSHIVAMRNPGAGLHAALMALSLAAGVLAVMGYAHLGFDVFQGPLQFAGAAGSFAVTFGALAFIGIAIEDHVRRRGFKKRATSYLRATSWEQMLVDLSHERKRSFYRPSWDGYDDTPTIRQIILPPAPPEVIDVVCRISRARALEKHDSEKFRLQIAAEADAIAFKGGVRGLFDIDAIEAQIERERQIKADPILYVVIGSAVAIVGQYGDLPAERAVIDGIVNSEHLL